MKKILPVVLFLLLFPSIVLAKDTCNNNDIKIEEITIEEKEGNTEELTPVNIDNNKINLNLEMYNVGESITYKIKVKNNSNNDYYFTKDSFNLSTDCIEYSLLNNSEVIKSNEEKSIQLKIMYKEKISEDEFTENNRMSITLSDTPLSNPSTKRTISLILLVTFITIIVITINRNKKLNKVLIGLILCFIPLSIKALCTVNLEINANITINEKEAVFLPGKKVNVKMKNLAGDDTSTVPQSHYYKDTNITAITHSSTEPNESEKQEKNIVSAEDSPYPIYMWYEEDTIYWWSEAHHPKLNQDGSLMFTSIENLNSIVGVKNFDVSNTTTISLLFSYCTNLINLEGLEDWDTRNVTTLEGLFQHSSINSLEALRKWDVSKVTTLFQAFLDTKLINLKGLEEWDTSSLESLASTFLECGSLTSVKALEKWNISKVRRLTQTFSHTSLENLEGLEDWDVSHVESFVNTFILIPTLANASAINDWDIQPTADFGNMFYSTPTHPEFSKVPGTWSNGTFTPTP